MPLKEQMTLHQIQCQMAAAIMRPLVDGKIQKQWTDGSDAQHFAETFISPNKDLKSLERLEIYNQQYWMRLLGSLEEDFPALHKILGDEKFERLCVAYLSRHPSKSFLLSYLGEQLPQFILDNPRFTGSHADLAYEIASFEWAEVVAYDSEAKAPLKAEFLQGKDPTKITLKLQPHLTLLKLTYALDDFVIKLSKPADRSVESNAFAFRTKKTTKISLPTKKHIFVVVYRSYDVIYYKRLNSDQYFLLNSLSKGNNLAQACHDLIAKKNSSDDVQSLAKKLNKYFATWMELSWFCH